MGDYNKLNQRFLNKGLNIAVDPSVLDYGHYTILDNFTTVTEGVLETRPGLTRLTTTPFTEPVGDLLLETGSHILLETGDKILLEDEQVGNTVTAIRRLNRISPDFSCYIVKAGHSVYATVDGSNHATTVAPFTWQLITTGFSENTGHLLPDRVAKPTEAWMYVSDPDLCIKIHIKTDGTLEWFNVGITRPTGPPTLANGASPGSLGPGDTYTYRYTLYNSSTGCESLFNSVEGADRTVGGGESSIDVTIPTETLDPDDGVDKARIYRIGGSLSLYRFIAEVAYTGTTVTYTDVDDDATIASADLLNLFSDKAFTSAGSGNQFNAGQRAGPVFGYTLAIGDVGAPGYLYWSDKFNPEMADPANCVEVDSSNSFLQGVLVFDNTSYVFTRENLFRLIVGQTDNTFTPYKTQCGRGLYFPDAFCIGPAIFFMAKDGIYMTNGGEAVPLGEDTIRPLFFGRTVGTCEAIDLTDNAFFRMAYYKREVWFQYRGADSGLTSILVYHLDFKRWRQVGFRTSTLCMYADEGGFLSTTFAPETRLLLGDADGYVVSHEGNTDAGGSPASIPLVVQTQHMVLGAPLMHKEYGALVLDLNPNSNSVTVAAYTNKGTNTVATATYSDAIRVRKFLSLADTFAEDLTINISGTGPGVKLYGYELLYRPEVVQLERWSVTGADHGVQGWQILRAAYITLRSDGTVGLTVKADGVTSSYLIPSTSGLKRKVFIPLNPTKGKVFDYTLNLGTATYFRLYNDECEVEVKPWVTQLGYARPNPFKGGEVVESSSGS